MATLSELIRDALRENNIIARNAVPTDLQFSEGLSVFQQMIDGWYGMLVGEFMVDWPVPPVQPAPSYARYPLLPADDQRTSDQWPYPPSNVRLLTANTTPNTVYLQWNPAPGAGFALVNISQNFVASPLTINANGRLISGAPTLTINTVQTAPRRWFFREDIATWLEITALALTDLSPFAPDLDDFMKVALATRLGPRYGVSLDPTTGAVFKMGVNTMKARYQQKGPTPINENAIGFNTPQSYMWSSRFWQGQ